MQLTQTALLPILETLAPPAGAAEWDNTGLILEGIPDHPIRRILLTLDLTNEVAAEALETQIDFIIAYHPPIFSGLKHFTLSDPATAPLLRLLRAGIAVYSPHTALDAAPGGMSDWLAETAGITACESVDGSGRTGTLASPQSPTELAATLQTRLQLPYVRLATAPSGPDPIRTLAVCPGAGVSVLSPLSPDAVLTGEMKHHDILHFTRRGIHVLLSEHTHTERPYLPVFRSNLLKHLPDGVEVRLSERDRDPVQGVWPHA